MNFADTPAEAEFRRETRAFLEEHAPAHAMAAPGGMSDPETVRRSKAWQACKYDHGWACLTWPTHCGGRDASSIESMIFSQEEGRFDLPPNIFTVGTGFMGPAIMAHGDEAQKERFLKKLARGDEIWCQLFSEPAAGSDLAGLRTSATRDGDTWLINGQKNWTTGAQISDYGVIVTRTDPGVAKHAGLTCFIVDLQTPGIEVRPLRQMDGSEDFNEVFLTDVRVPDKQRLGAIGDGWSVALTILMNERYTLGGGVALAPEKLLDRAARAGRHKDSDVRQTIADFYIRATGLKYTGYRTLTALSRGKTPGPESSVRKLIGGALGQRVASFAIELDGESGAVLGRGSFARPYLAAPGVRIAGGTDEIMRNIVAERVLGLPGEPRIDKDRPFRDIPAA